MGIKQKVSAAHRAALAESERALADYTYNLEKLQSASLRGLTADERAALERESRELFSRWKLAEEHAQSVYHDAVSGAALRYKSEAVGLLEKRLRLARELIAAEHEMAALSERIGRDVRGSELLLGLVPIDTNTLSRFLATIETHTRPALAKHGVILNGNGKH